MTLMTFLILFLSAIGPNFFPKTTTELQDKTWTNIGFDYSCINNLVTLYLDIKWTNAGHIEIQFLSIYCPSNKFISKFLYITVLQGLDKYWTNIRCINLKYIQALYRLCPAGVSRLCPDSVQMNKSALIKMTMLPGQILDILWFLTISGQS